MTLCGRNAPLRRVDLSVQRNLDLLAQVVLYLTTFSPTGLEDSISGSGSSTSDAEGSDSDAVDALVVPLMNP